MKETVSGSAIIQTDVHYKTYECSILCRDS